MKLCDLSVSQVRDVMRGAGLQLKIGPFWFSIVSALPDVQKHLIVLYAQAPIDLQPRFIDFSIEVSRKKHSLRGWFKPLAEFTFNATVPFTPLPLGQSPALLEWGINWCVSAHAHQFLILHAAVLEKNGKALVMPASSGSGKSTLSAALMANGWRLLSDELALLCTETGEVAPFTKPISLKNESIKVISDFWANACFGKHCTDTVKGTVSHLRVSDFSMIHSEVSAKVSAVIFPQYIAESTLALKPRSRASAFIAIAENAFNYYLLGEKGFNCAASILTDAEAFDLEFGDLRRAVDIMNALWES